MQEIHEGAAVDLSKLGKDKDQGMEVGPVRPPRKRKNRRKRTGRRPSSRHRRALDRERQRSVRLIAGLRRVQDEHEETDELIEGIIKTDREFQDGPGA